MSEIWQRLMALESYDLVCDLFERIHGRKLSTRRAGEIRSAARQAREYFRQAGSANFTVRPLLTFYGVASLSRSLTLLMRRFDGEQSLTKGHGLETVAWPDTLSSDLSASLSKLGSIRVRTCGGLFTDLLNSTKNRICMHVRSQAVDWRIYYDIPNRGHEFSFSDLIERLPDLKLGLDQAKLTCRFFHVNEIKFNNSEGFFARVSASSAESSLTDYRNRGFSVTKSDNAIELAASADIFSEAKCQFLHAYVQKTFGVIPNLYIVETFSENLNLSQIGVSYIVSFYLGMLARYYPTHWIALVEGAKGDRLWPTLSRAQQYVETVFPELVIEFIEDVVAYPFESIESAQ